MTEETRGRGRPKGASRYKGPDGELLGRVADRLLEEPALPFTTAARRILAGKGTDSHIRRLQRRWKKEGGAYLAAAGERAARRREVHGIRPEALRNGYLGRLTADDATALNAMAAAKKIAALGASLNKAIASEEVLRAAKHIQALHESVRLAAESPAMAKFAAHVTALQGRMNQWATPTWLEQLARSATQWDENMRRILAPLRANEIAQAVVLPPPPTINGALPPKDR